MLKTFRFWIVLSLSLIFYCYEFFLRISPGLILGTLMQYYHLTALGISSLLASYYIAYTLMQVFAGLLLDRFPVHRVLPSAVLVCVLAVLLFCSPNVDMAHGGRFLLGIGSAFSFIGVLKIARVYLPSRYFSLVVGITVSLGTLAASYAEVVMAILNQRLAWQIIFEYAALIGLLIALGLYMTLKTLPKHLEEAPPSLGYKHTALAFWQLVKAWPLWLNGLVGGLFYLPTSVFAAVWGISFLKAQYGLSTQVAAFHISIMFFGWVIGSPIVGWTCERFKTERRFLFLCALAAAAVISGLFYLAELVRPFLPVLMLLFGLFSSGQVVVWRTFNRLAPRELSATGIAFTNMLIMICAAMVQLLAGYLMDWHQQHEHLGSYDLSDYHFALGSLPIALFCAAAIALFIPQNRHRT